MVCVISKSGKPLMPCKSARAKHLLMDGEAVVKSIEPFTIQLTIESTEEIQPITVGVDLGANEVGLAAVGNGKVLYQGEVALRTDICIKGKKDDYSDAKGRMPFRAMMRRNRRNRKCRYRAPRFDNRASARRKGLRQPSIKSRSDTTIKAVKRITGFLPISAIRVERAQFDTQAMRVGRRLPNWAYQLGELYRQENIKMYVRQRDKYTCQYCGKKNPNPVEVDHIVPVSRGGSTAPHNMVATCHECNQAKGKMTAAEFGYPEVQKQVRKSLKVAAHTQMGQNVTIKALAKIAPVSETYGYITKVDREQMGLPKTHYYDAVAIAAEGDVVEPLGWVEKIKAVSKGQRQLFKANPSKGHVFRACRMPYEVFGFRMWDKVELPDGRIGFVGARRKTGSFRIRSIDGSELCSKSYKKLRLLERVEGSLVKLVVWI